MVVYRYGGSYIDSCILRLSTSYSLAALICVTHVLPHHILGRHAAAELRIQPLLPFSAFSAFLAIFPDCSSSYALLLSMLSCSLTLAVVGVF